MNTDTPNNIEKTSDKAVDLPRLVRLSSNEGPIYLSSEDIVAVAATSRASINANVWLRGYEEPFNILETVDEIMGIIQPNTLNKQNERTRKSTINRR